MAGPYIIPPQRFSRVPWLWKTDLEEGRDPLWGPHGTNHDVRSAWRVDLYERDLFPGIDQMALLVHAIRGNGNDGGVITLCIRPIVEDEKAKMDMRKLAQKSSQDDVA